jgi:hypothetical protein
MRKSIVVLAMLALVVPVLAGTLNPVQVTPSGVTPVVGGEPRALSGNVVYDNTVNEGLYYYNHTGLEVGDDISMTGIGDLQAFSFVYYDTVGAFSADVRFYEQDPITYDVGALIGSYWVSDLPGVGGWQIDIDPVDYPITFNTPDIYMTVQFDVTGCGLIMYDPPTVGVSYDYFVKNLGASWGYYWFGGDPVANFGLAVSLTPEPASLSLLVVGALALLRRR